MKQLDVDVSIFVQIKNAHQRELASLQIFHVSCFTILFRKIQRLVNKLIRQTLSCPNIHRTLVESHVNVIYWGKQGVC